MTDKKKDRPFVFVRCMTYNHEHYVEDALKGFAVQQTNFPFVVAVVDDASTDNNALVITKWVSEHCERNENYYAEDKDYGRVIHAQAKDNPNCLFYVILLKENHFRKKPKNVYYAQYENTAKYEALCEGDDYWTDPLKLQKQVDFLEGHPDFVACCTRYQYYYLKTKKNDVDHFEELFKQGEEGIEYNHDNYFEIGLLPQVLTMMYRTDTFPSDAYYYKLKCKQDDAMFYCMTLYGKIWLMNEVTGVYRKHDYSMTWEVSQGGAIAQAKMLHDIWLDCWQYEKSNVLRGTVLWSIQQLCTSTIRYAKKWDTNTINQCIEEHRSIASQAERYGFYKAMLRAIIVRFIKRPYKKR